MDVLIWKIENQQYAIDLAVVDYLFLAAEMTLLPHAPDDIGGVLNLHGQVIPVVNVRKCLGFSAKEIEITDHFILCHVHQNQILLWVDTVCYVKSFLEEDLIPAHQVLANFDAVEHVLKEKGEIILLYDLQKLLPSHTITVK